MNETTLIEQLDALAARRAQVSDFESTSQPVVSGPLRFRPWNVESLLNDATSLLDRCLAERTYFEDQLARAAALRLEQLGQVLEAKSMDALINTPEDGNPVPPDFLLESAQRHYEAASELSNSTRWKEIMRVHSRLVQKPTKGGDPEWTVRKTALRDRQQLISASLAAAKTTEALRNTLVDQRRQTKYRKALLAGRQQVNDARADAMSDGNPLDYGSRVEKSIGRFLRDLVEALAILLAARDGLSTLFDYKDPDREPFGFTQERTWLGCADLDEMVAWTRNATMWLRGFKQLDQGFNELVSISSLATSGGGELNFVANSTALFVLPPTRFAGLYYLRVRAVAAVVVLKAGAAASGARFKLVLRAPQIGSVQHGAGKSPARLDQSSAPLCILGRVASRTASREPETGGMVSWMNISPASFDATHPWELTVSPASADAKLSDIADIELELTLSARAGPSA